MTKSDAVGQTDSRMTEYRESAVIKEGANNKARAARLAERYYDVIIQELELSALLATPSIIEVLGTKPVCDSLGVIRPFFERAETLYSEAGRPEMPIREVCFASLRGRRY